MIESPQSGPVPQSQLYRLWTRTTALTVRISQLHLPKSLNRTSQYHRENKFIFDDNLPCTSNYLFKGKVQIDYSTPIRLSLKIWKSSTSKAFNDRKPRLRLPPLSWLCRIRSQF